MSLLARIEKDYLEAYKAKDELRVAVLRLLKTAAKNRQVELMRPLTDDEMLEVIGREVKKRQEAAEQFAAGNRPEMAARESAEREALQVYLPEPLSREELDAAIAEIVVDLKVAGPKDMGRVMQAVMSRFKGRVDGKQVSELVRSRLSA
mgnify:CR=1 FL=1